MNDPLLAVDAMNWWTRMSKTYESDANRLAHEASALEFEIPIVNPKLQETQQLLADCKYTLSEGFHTYAKALLAHGKMIAQLVEEKQNEGRSSSGSVPGTQAPLGPRGATE